MLSHEAAKGQVICSAYAFVTAMRALLVDLPTSPSIDISADFDFDSGEDTSAY